MVKIKLLVIILAILSVVSVLNASNIIYVDASSPNDPGSGTIEDPFRKIQNAINYAAAGDTVKIRPSIYSGPGNYNLDPAGKAITISSTNPEDAEVVANTVIDPNKAGRGFYFHSGEDANCIISGLTIRNAYTGGKGGGVFCYNSSPTIINCVITGNSAGTHGGGFFFQLSNAAVIGCVITSNTAVLDGGGLECWSGNAVITNCIISNNNALYGNGGGVDCFHYGNTTVKNCTLVKNSSNFGGGLYCLGSEVTFTNNIVWANDANQGSQIGLESYAEMISSLPITYSDVQGGSTLVYDPCGLLVWGKSNLDIDPCFASFNPEGDPNLWDFHLKSIAGRWNSTFYRIDLNNNGAINLIEFARIANVWMQQDNMPEDLDNSGTVDWTDLELFAQYYLANSIEDGWVTDSSTSPCVDAGDPNSDWTGEPWPNGKRINMGAYGGTNQASMSGNPADFNIDGLVNFVDFAEFASHWKTNENCIEDLNLDSIVGYEDLCIFTGNWLWQKK